MSYAVRLEFPPSINHYWRRWQNRTLLSAAGRQYKVDVQADVLQTLGLVKPLTGRIGVSIELYRKDRRAYDVDNYAKSVLDSLTGVLFEDDGQVDWLQVKRCEVTPPGFCDVIVSELVDSPRPPAESEPLDRD